MQTNIDDIAAQFGSKNVADAIDLLEACGALKVNRSGTEVTIQATDKLMGRVRAAGITRANIDQHVRRAINRQF
jgi:hypothetical protein